MKRILNRKAWSITDSEGNCCVNSVLGSTPAAAIPLLTSGATMARVAAEVTKRIAAGAFREHPVFPGQRSFASPARYRTNRSLLVAAILATLSALPLLAQGSLNEFPSGSIEPTFQRSFTLAPAEETTGGGGGDSEERTAALARAVQNPVANLISVPFQNNFNFGIGPNDVTQWVLNVQPVIPITLNEDWNLITRTIMPIINQPSPAPGVSSAFGLGDINPSFFLSPGKPGKFIWGAGPTFTFPTATDSELGSGMYSAGPALVGLVMEGHWVVGALVNNQWSYAGWRDQNVNAMTLQYFINYNLPKGWYLTSSPIITANWKADSSERWTVPVGAGVGKIVHVGKLPLNVQLAGYYNAETPETFGADWQMRFQVQFLFPK